MSMQPFLSNVSDYINVCSLYGYACPNRNKDCDCTLANCNTSEQLVNFRVLNDESVYVMEKRLLPGSYCLPKGVGECDTKTSIEFFSLAGWSCIPKNASWISKRLPCTHPEAKNNSLNVLWDEVKNIPANENEIEDYYEMKSDGLNFRYNCKCNSLDFKGKRMVSVLPLTCSVDECVRDIPNPLPGMGWNGEKCVCGLYQHEDSNDHTSKCVQEKTFRRDNILHARVNCMDQYSLFKSGLYCPKNEYYLNFETKLVDGFDPWNFVDKIIQEDAP